MSSAPAAAIGPYRVVRTVAAGGNATVFEVEAPDGRVLALKRMRDDLPESALARFRREVDSLRRIDHPGVLALIDAGVDGGAPYLVTPLIAGHSLRELLARGPLGVEGALAIAVAAAEAVAIIHRAGLVHRDLKPENLMVSAEGQVVVIDLGLALGPEHSRHTAEDTVTGSVPYMAPEQIEDRMPSPASDVWALGVILYEAIAGRRPFQRERQSEEVAAILAGRHVPLDEVERRCPAALAELIAACLSPSPSRRPADGTALTTALVAEVDWVAPGALAGQRARLIADRDGFAAEVSAARVELAARAAESALAGGDRFAASRALDRALAYAPSEPRLLALVDRVMAPVMAAPAGEAPPRHAATVRGHAPPPRPPDAVGAGRRPGDGDGEPVEPGPAERGGDGVGAAIDTRPGSSAAAVNTAPGTGREDTLDGRRGAGRWLWPAIAAAATVVAIGAAVGALAMRSERGVPRAPASAASLPDGAAAAVAGERLDDAGPAEAPPPPIIRPAHVAPSRPAPGRTPPGGPP